MKKSKITTISKILAILIICLVSFVGIYVQKTNKMENIVKDYKYSKELSGYRQIIFEISDATEVTNSEGKVVGNTDQYDDDAISTNSYTKTENPVNKEENLNEENYEKAQKVIEKRLDSFEIEDYNLSLEKSTGKLYLQIPEDENADRVVSNITEKGTFEIKDSEDGTVFITNNQVKKASTMYNTTEQGTTVYLHIQLNKEGKETLRNLSENEYATVEETSTENTTEGDTTNETENNVAEEETNNVEDEASSENTTESEENATEETESEDENTETTEEAEETQKEIVLSISGNDMVTTSFDDPVVDGVIDLSMNSASTDNEQISETLTSTSTIAAIINSGEMPLVYKVTENQYVVTEISDTIIRNVIITIGVVIVLLLVFMVIKHKMKGLLATISYIGFIALYLLLIRYTNVEISISGAIAMLFVLILNYILNMKLLATNPEDSKEFKQEYIKFIIKTIPLLIISIAFIFLQFGALNSFGMLAFWGIVLIMIYNILVTRYMVN